MTVTNISQSCYLQDGAKINWHRYGTKLRHCHPMHTDKSNSSSIPTLYWQTVEIIILEGKYSLESTDLRKSEIRAPPQPLPYLMPIPPNTLSTPIPSRTTTWQHFIDLLKRNKNPQFMAFLDSNLHTQLVIVTKNELGLAFPPRNLSKKFRPHPSTFYLVIVVTNRQTDKTTPVKT